MKKAKRAKSPAKKAKKVQPIPAGYHAVTPYLSVRGAAEAIEFYKKAFGATEVMRMPGPDGKIAHATLTIGDATVYLCEEMMGNKAPNTLGGSSVTLHMYVPDADATWKLATEAGAKVMMPIDDMFWGDRYGKVTDPFGHGWSFSTPLSAERHAKAQKAWEEWQAQQKAA